MKPVRAMTPEERDGLMLMTPEDVHEVTGWHVQRILADIRKGVIPAARRGPRGRCLLSMPQVWRALSTMENATAVVEVVTENPTPALERGRVEPPSVVPIVSSLATSDASSSESVRKLLKLVRVGVNNE